MNGNINTLYHYYNSYFELNITQLLYNSSNKIKYNKYEKKKSPFSMFMDFETNI